MRLNLYGASAALALAVTVCASQPAWAEVDALVREAQDLIAKGQAQQAFALLEAKEPQRSGDPDFDLTLGTAAIQTTKFSRAIFALERVLLVQPENSQARVELGKALFSVGDSKEARAVLSQTKEQGVPVEVAKTIDQFLQAIDKVDEAGRSSIKGYVDAGLGFDSNVNGGPSDSAIAVPSFGGTIVTLNAAGTKTSAWFSTLGAGLSGRHVVDSSWSLIGSLNGNGRWNAANASQFDSLQMDANGGASYRVNRNEYSLVVQAVSNDVNGARERNQVGLVGEWIYRLDGFRQFSTYAQVSQLRYPQQGLRDAQRNVLGTSYAHLFRNGLMVFGGVYFGSENESSSGVSYLGHNLTGIRGGAQKPFNDSLAAFMTVGVEDRTFGGKDPLFLVGRQDQQTDLALGLSWVPAKSWRVTPQLAYSRTASNIAINDFNKASATVTVRREF
jgi:hypothetical protein